VETADSEMTGMLAPIPRHKSTGLSWEYAGAGPATPPAACSSTCPTQTPSLGAPGHLRRRSRWYRAEPFRRTGARGPSGLAVRMLRRIQESSQRRLRRPLGHARGEEWAIRRASILAWLAGQAQANGPARPA
jgi:hypothetical protein